MALPPTAHLPSQFQEWPDDVLRTQEEVVRMYHSGFAGAYRDDAAKAEFESAIQAAGGDFDGERVAYANSLVGSGEGKLSIPFIYTVAHYPKAWPCPGQTTGDCVSHAGKNSALILICIEAAMGLPDPVTNIVETYPEVTPEGESQGVVACENIYRARGHSGQGANCNTLQNYVVTKGGILIRKNYPELGVDFTRYNASLGIPGGQGVPASWTAEGAKHQIRTATSAPNHENVRDFIANGYPSWNCSGLGWSSNRDENGYSRQQGGWSHSWVVMGYDDRDIVKQKYGFPLFLYNHDWGRWNSGGRDIMASAEFVPPGQKDAWIKAGLVNPATGNIMIPEGSFWGDARLLDRCECTAMSNLNGWPARKLPPVVIDVG